LRTGVLFPGTVITLPVGRKRSVALVESLRTGDVVGTVTQKDPKVADPVRSDLYDVGTFVRVADITRLPGSEYRVTLEALNRFALTSLSADGGFWLAEGTLVEDKNDDSQEARLLADSLRELVQELAGNSGGALAQVALSGA
jgi:ATP-dependent Lon protease